MHALVLEGMSKMNQPGPLRWESLSLEADINLVHADVWQEGWHSRGTAQEAYGQAAQPDLMRMVGLGRESSFYWYELK